MTLPTYCKSSTAGIFHSLFSEVWAAAPENQQSAYAKTKAQISFTITMFTVTVKLISAFVFATLIVQFLYFQNLKFPVSSHLLCLYNLVCVRPVQKPHCWFSHDAAQLFLDNDSTILSDLLHFDIYEPCHEKTRLLPMRKQRRRSAVQYLQSWSVPLFSLHG